MMRSGWLSLVLAVGIGLYSLTGLCSAKKKIGQKQANIVGLERAINAGSIYCGAQGNSKRSKQPRMNK